MSGSNSEEMDKVKMERRRLRMRLAQRKHRARQEQKVQDLENEIQSLQTRADAFESHFGRLEIKLLEASACDPSLSSNIRRAIDFFRHSSNLKPVAHHNQSIPKAVSVLDAGVATFSDPWFPTPEEALPTFSLKLYEYCTRLALRILSARDGPSIRLARKIFHYRLGVDSKNGEEYNFMYLQDVLRMRAVKLDNKNSAAKSCLKGLSLPRWPGFSDYLDVVGVERYLRDKGYRFTDDAIELSTDDAMMSNDFLNVETDSSANPKVPVELPFGLVDPDAHVVEGGLLSPRSQGSPQLDDWTQFDTMMNEDLDLNGSPDPLFGQASVRISFHDLIERLALYAICMGGPGPGILPGEVDAALEHLTSRAWQLSE